MLAWLVVVLAAVSPFEAAMGRAVAHYNEAEWDAALKELAIAERQAGTDTERVAVWMHQGVVLANVPDAEAAKAVWRRALEEIPAAPLPLQVSPRVKSLFEEVQREVATRAPADAPKQAALAPAPKNELAGGSGVPIVPIVSLGVAVAAGGVGLGFAISASSLLNAARVADPASRDALRSEASTHSLVGNIAFVVAGAAALTALITFIVLD